jgi:hypothetical protein
VGDISVDVASVDYICATSIPGDLTGIGRLATTQRVEHSLIGAYEIAGALGYVRSAGLQVGIFAE